MFKDRYIFSQIVDFISHYELDKCVEKYRGDKYVRRLSCRDQLLALMFGQLASLKSLRGIVLCLNVHPNQLYHLGFKTRKFTLSTLARANQFRDWRIWREFTEYLTGIARRLYTHDNDFTIELKNSVYALDSTALLTKPPALDAIKLSHSNIFIPTNTIRRNYAASNIMTEKPTLTMCISPTILKFRPKPSPTYTNTGGKLNYFSNGLNSI